jgi:hypothetical protein
MDVLQSVVATLTKEEVRNLKLWLQSTNSGETRKDVQLFDYIRKMDDRYDESSIHKKIYGKDDKNSFYRLKNRLLEDIGYNLSLLHFNKHEQNNLYHLLGLYQIFLSRSKPEIGLYYLKKACKKAEQTENFEILDIVYANYVRISSDLPEVNPEHYIKLRKDNAIKLGKIRETDQVLAALTYRLKLSQNYGKRDVGLLKLLDNTIKEFSTDDSLRKSKSFQTRVFRALSQILIQNHNFIELEKFAITTYGRFNSEKWFDKTNHETKLQMLVYIINSLFKNRKYADSLDYAETLGEEMSAFNSMLYDKYMFFYYNALVINYSQIDLKRGLKALDELEKEMKGKKNAYYEFFILLNKANLLFFQGRNDDAIRSLVRLYVNDHYKKADVSFKLKIAIAECMMQYESGDESSTIKRVEQVKKQFASILGSDDYKRERFILKIIPQMLLREINSNTKLSIEITRFVKSAISESVEDGEVLRYRAWLAPKVGVELI